MKSLQEYIQEMRPAVERELQAMIDRSVPKEYSGLRDMLVYHMGWEGEGAGSEAQGKRIRPVLSLLCAEAAGGDWRNALPVATAVELLHNFSLIHDDIQDNSPLRRNRPTVWTKWGAPQAINAGDTIFVLSFLALQDLDRALPAESVIRANRILQQTCLSLTQGQYLDMSYETKGDLPVDAYWSMIGGKTSALLSGCAELGALAGGAQEPLLGYFREYGYTLGLAFQVLDDWLGIWGDVHLTGKSIDSDLVAGKKTLPVLFGLNQNGQFAQRWRRGAIQPEETAHLAHLLDEEGASAYTLDTASRLTQQSMVALSKATNGSPAALALEELTQMLLRRKK